MASSTNGVNSVMGMNVSPTNRINTMSLGEQYYAPTALPKDPGQIKVPAKTPAPGASTGPSYSQIQTGLAGGKFMLDVINAQSAYQTISGQAELNIMQARNSAADALHRGRQAQLDAQSIGYEQGNQDMLSAAAQGQDVSGAAVQKVKGSHEAMGVYNGMREEINSMREALGFDLEEVNYNYQVEQADIQRTNSIIGSALNFGATAYYYGK